MIFVIAAVTCEPSSTDPTYITHSHNYGWPQPSRMANQQPQHHFLVVTVEAQGHINPARHLARILVRSCGARVTLASPTTAFRRMFPSHAGDHQEVEEEDGMLSYTHYSNGTEDGAKISTDLPVVKLRIKQGLARLADDLAARGRPVTCIIYALLLSMAPDVAREIGVPSVLFWIQPAAVFAIYHRYFHGYADVIAAHRSDPTFTVELPGLPPLQIRDLPSFLTTPNTDDNPYALLYNLLEDVFRTLDREATGSKTRVLVNTFQELETDVLSSIEGTEMIAVGPLAASGAKNGGEHSNDGGDLFEYSRGYMEWLESKAEGSVVYVSFGSISTLSRQQMEEISGGLEESGRPYLWVVRRDNRGGEEEVLQLQGGGGMGMVVEWCSQVEVLSHRSVGCFVTHCGWNSTLESLVCGVPTVMVPQWTDQLTNARLAEGAWGMGVRAKVKGHEGVLEGTELRRCVDLVMGEGGGEIQRRARMWRDKARAALGEGGSSARNLKAFMETIEG